ncbi:hypothetical protein TNCV_1277691 [Trichonephila clavipes]|nr:hypothetical protein TNCV_1277691 [Trichonephila clavipes]
MPQLLPRLNEDDPDRRTQLCEWYLAQVEIDANFVPQVMWSLLLMGLPQEPEITSCTLGKLRIKIETVNHTILAATLRDATNNVRHRAQKSFGGVWSTV